MNYHNITYPDQNNGDGLRVVLWLSGCSHHCHNCQNPQTWDPESGILFNDDAKKEIFEQLEKDYISGITFSGGDPLYKNNLNDLYELIIDIKSKFPEKTIWLYTGYTWESIFFLSMEHVDIMRAMIVLLCDVIVDGEYVDHLRDVSLHWRGSSNQRVIDVKESLLKFDRKNIHSEITLWE